MSSVPARRVPEPEPRRDRPVCYLSRSRGWVDPGDPHRPASEVNLLAVALGSKVWTTGTAWESVFRRPIPLEVARAYGAAMARSPVSDRGVELLVRVARALRVELRVID